jgi:hypothetical protein
MQMMMVVDHHQGFVDGFRGHDRHPDDVAAPTDASGKTMYLPIWKLLSAHVRTGVLPRWEIDPLGVDAYDHSLSSWLGRWSGTSHVDVVHLLVERPIGVVEQIHGA